MSTIKEQAKEIVEQLPEEATWDDLMYRIYVRQKIAAGEKDVAEGRTVTQEEVKRRLLRQ